MKARKYPSVMNPQDKGYPIRPKHINIEDEPKGFDILLGYSDRNLLWLFMSSLKLKGDWLSFTDSDFMNFLDNSAPIKMKNKFLVGHFVGPVLASLFDRSFVDKENRDYKKGYIYTPSHFVVSTYFMWNPVKIPK